METASRPILRDTGPALIGRYSILRLIGAGGMGIVYTAWDPELDRKVAVKLLHPNLSGDPDVARARLLREAQAMARLSHPNVVSVYDMGTHDGQIFIAMEFVQGVSLAVWLHLQPRTWREIVAVFREAGKGLVAAHQHGLVHGDFKPDNVLVGDDGRVRVVDFGLAFAIDRDPDVPAPDVEALRSGAFIGLDTRLTRSGALTGTPAYCAPEQFRGDPGSPLADQFSFCVSLHEALYGARPFPGDDINALARSITDGRMIPEPPGAKVPAWLRKIVLRGLELDPQRRFPDVPALLAALARDPTRRRRRRLAVGLTLLALAVAAYTYRWFVLRGLAERQGLCAAAEHNLVGVWDPARKHTVRTAMLATGLAYAEDAWTRVAARLDDYTAAWTAMHTEACEATHLRGEQSVALLDLRMACLRRQLSEVRALVGVLATADADVVERASQAVTHLPHLPVCADVAALQGDDQAADSPEAVAIREELDAAHAHLRLARIADGLTIAREVLTRARVLDDPHLLAQAHSVHGNLLDEAGEPVNAAAALTDAFLVAESTRDARLPATVAIALIHNAGNRNDLPAAHLWARHADALVQRTRLDHPATAHDLTINLLNARGTLAVHEGERGLAEQHFAAALDAGPADKFVRAGLHNNLGNILVRRGDLAGAERHLQQSLSLYRDILGEQHPSLAVALNNLSEVHMRRGDYQPAESLYHQAQAILVAASGPTHPNVGVVHNNLGDVLRRLGRRDQAREHYTRARTIFQIALGQQNPALAYPLTGMGELLVDDDRPADALPLLEQALALREGGDPTDLARTRFALARALGPTDGPRAHALASQARTDYTSAGPAYARELAEVTAWLAGRSAPSPL